MSKHTPGPWSVCEDEPSVGGCRNGLTVHIAGCGMEQAHGDHIPSAEAFANARLIAVAPELLSIVRIVQQITALDVNDLVGRIQIVLLQGTLAALCKMALAKVEGIKEEIT